MSLKPLLKAATATALLALVAAESARAEPTVAEAKTQVEAAQATGKPTSDPPAKTQPQGTAWAVQQAVRSGAAGPAAGGATTTTTTGDTQVKRSAAPGAGESKR